MPAPLKLSRNHALLATSMSKARLNGCNSGVVYSIMHRLGSAFVLCQCFALIFFADYFVVLSSPHVCMLL